MLPENGFEKYLRGRLLLRRAFFASVLAFALVAAASGLVEELYVRKALWIPLAILAWLAMIGIGMFLRNAECPRCSNRFAAHASGSRYNSLTLTCLNCGLSLRDSADVRT